MMRRNGKNIRSNFAVAEIVGTILMLGLATSSFTVVYYQVKTAPTPTPSPIVEISGTIDNNQVILMHRGGEPLDLDTELVLNVGGKSKIYKVGDLLDSKSKEDGFWDLSEELVYKIDYDFDYSEYPNININILDGVSNSLLMTGLTRVNPECDISVEVSVDNLHPKEFETVEFTITTTNNGNINASGILIDFLLPEGLNYIGSILDQGSYDSNSGILNIDNILSGESVEVNIIAIVGDVIYAEPTQLVVILDGSESIEPVNWTLMLKGLSEAIKDESRFSHKGVIELTVIQFGGLKPAYARLEIGPIIITETNFHSVVNNILKIPQIKGKTPTSCAFLMAADYLKNSDMFDADIKQIVLFVTDGNPTHCGYVDGDYLDDPCSGLNGPKVNAVESRDYLIKLLDLDEDQDEINALSIEVTGDGHTYYLKDDIVWPQPGYELSEAAYNDENFRGWIKHVKTWKDFAESINLAFDIMFNTIRINLSVKSTGFYDPKEFNDMSIIILKPQPDFSVIN